MTLKTEYASFKDPLSMHRIASNETTLIWGYCFLKLL